MKTIFEPLLGVGLGFIAVAWSYSLPLVMGESVWNGMWFYSFFIALLALGLLSLRLVKKAVQTLPFCSGLALGSCVSQGLMLPFLGAQLTLGIGIVLTMTASAIRPSPLCGSQPSPIDRGKNTDAYCAAFFSTGLLLLTWQKVQSYSAGSLGAQAGFAFVAFIGLIAAQKIRKSSIPDWDLTTVVWVSWLTSVLTSGFLTPSYYSPGNGWLEVLGFLFVTSILVLPAQVILWQKISGQLSVKHLCSILGGLLLTAAFTKWIGPSWTHAIWVVAALFFYEGRNLLEKPAHFKKKWLLIAALLPLASASIESQRTEIPVGETTLALARDRGDVFALSRTNTDGDLRIWRNLHQLIVSLKPYAQLRRHAILALRLHAGAKKILIVGGQNPIGVSAALELPLESLTVVEPARPLFDWARWFTSEAASKNRITHAQRIVGSAPDLLGGTGPGSFDAVILEGRAPWSPLATEYHSLDFYRTVARGMTSDGIAVQWFLLSQWSERALARAYGSWREAFTDREITLWRAHLSPDAPMVAFVAQGKSISQGGYGIEDSFLGTPQGTVALFLGDHAALDQVFGHAALSPLRAGKPELEWISAWDRIDRSRFLGSDFVLRFLAYLTAKDGSSYGALLWTKAVMDYRRGLPTWQEERTQAIQYLGFDPSREYPEALPSGMPR